MLMQLMVALLIKLISKIERIFAHIELLILKYNNVQVHLSCKSSKNHKISHTSILALKIQSDMKK